MSWRRCIPLLVVLVLVLAVTRAATDSYHPPAVSGPVGGASTGNVCFYTDATGMHLGSDPLFQWYTTTKRLAIVDSGNNTMLADGTGYAPDISGGGMNNVLMGHNAGAAIHTAAGNVCIGSGAAASMTEMDYNVVIGYQADPDSIEGNGDVVIGYQAGRGVRTLHSQLDGNVIIGSFAGSTNGATDSENVIIGTDALPGIDNGPNMDAGQGNLVLGHRAGYVAAKLQGTVILGKSAAYSANLGLTHTIAIGAGALEFAPGGANETDTVAIGYQALRNENSSNGDNTAIGTEALTALTDGGQNTAVGAGALNQVVHGYRNTAVGNLAGRFVDGSGNTLVGQRAETLGGGVNSATAVGDTAQGTANYAIALGAGTQCTTAGTVCLGDANVTGKVIVGATRSAVLCDLIGTPTCGTGCATIVTNSDNCVGALTMTGATSAVLTWSGTRTRAPFCTVSTSSATITGGVTSPSTSSVTFVTSAALTGTVYYHCP